MSLIRTLFKALCVASMAWNGASAAAVLAVSYPPAFWPMVIVSLRSDNTFGGCKQAKVPLIFRILTVLSALALSFGIHWHRSSLLLPFSVLNGINVVVYVVAVVTLGTDKVRCNGYTVQDGQSDNLLWLFVAWFDTCVLFTGGGLSIDRSPPVMSRCAQSHSCKLNYYKDLKADFFPGFYDLILSLASIWYFQRADKIGQFREKDVEDVPAKAHHRHQEQQQQQHQYDTVPSMAEPEMVDI